MLTQGEAKVLQSRGEHLAINRAHPQNRRELRDFYRSMPRKIRSAVFGRWRRKGLVRPVAVAA